MHTRVSPRHGFTLVELVVIMAIVVGMVVFVMIMVPQIREKKYRKACEKNQVDLFKGASSWGLTPTQSPRSMFPETNFALQLAADGSRVAPDSFICPFSAMAYGKRPATNLATVFLTNTSYNYFMGRDEGDYGASVLFCDMNGPNNVDVNPAANRFQFGANHTPKRAEGGNYVLSSGACHWADSTNMTRLAGSGTYITNVGNIFNTNNNVELVPAGNFPAAIKRRP